MYRAQWKNIDVAVKEVNLPEYPENASAQALNTYKRHLQATTEDFIREVELLAPLNHPNLVRLLGYATKPRLYIVQEMMHGKALDKQLYTQQW